MTHTNTGEHAYDLACRAAALAENAALAPLVDGHVESPIGLETGRFTHSFGGVSLAADYERTCYKCEWHVVISSGGECVLDVVYDTNPFSDAPEITLYSPGSWEESLAAEETRLALALTGPVVF